MKFRCKQSGTVIEFLLEDQIEQMMREDHYEVVEEKVEKVEEKKKKDVK